MARTNYRGYLREPEVRLKKYFYVMRPLLAARWIAKGGAPPPMEFAKLLPLLQQEPAVLAEVNRLLILKRSTLELGLAPAVPTLNAFIEAELEGFTGEVAQKPHLPDAMECLNELFHRVLCEYRNPCDQNEPAKV